MRDASYRHGSIDVDRVGVFLKRTWYCRVVEYVKYIPSSKPTLVALVLRETWYCRVVEYVKYILSSKPTLVALVFGKDLDKWDFLSEVPLISRAALNWNMR